MGFTVLLIDDDPEWLVFLGRLLDGAGFHVVPLSDSNKFAQVVERKPQPDLVVTDLLMPGATASTIYHQVRDILKPDTPVIICTGTRMKVKVDDRLLAHVPKANAATDLVAETQRLLSMRAPAVANENDIDLDLDLDIDLDFPSSSSKDLKP